MIKYWNLFSVVSQSKLRNDRKYIFKRKILQSIETMHSYFVKIVDYLQMSRKKSQKTE